MAKKKSIYPKMGLPEWFRKAEECGHSRHWSDFFYDEIYEISVKKTNNEDWPYEGVIHYKVKD